MKGDGGDSGVGEYLSLGGSQSASSGRSGSRSRSMSMSEGDGDKEREGCSGRGASRHGELSSLLLMSPSCNVLSSLTRNGLSMLAGSNGGFSLKPAMGAPGGLGSSNLAPGVGAGKVCGGGFTGFYRASANKGAVGTATAMAVAGARLTTTTSQVLPGMNLFRCDQSDSSNRGGIAADKMLRPPDVENLTPDECWRLILKLGSRWPAWTGTTATARQQRAPQGGMDDTCATTHEQRGQSGNLHSLDLGRDALQLLAARALEALAQSPDRHGRSAGGMLAPKCTAQETPKTKADAAERDLPSTHQTTLATFVRQPSLFAKLPVSSSFLHMPAPKTNSSDQPRTAPLTIFYAGTVNVCDNVPEDKARLIMLFAGIPPDAQASAPHAPLPSEIVQPREELQLSKPSSEAVAPSATHAQASSSDKNPVESSNPSEMVPVDESRVQTKISITGGKSRQHGKRRAAKPLPNARKNSLARFLDSRKRSRPTTSSSETPPSKKPGLGIVGWDGCPSDGEDAKGNGPSPMASCSQSSMDSQEGILASCTYEADSVTN